MSRITTQEEISPENLKKGMAWNKAKTKLMLQFEKETGKLAVYRDKITGRFTHWLFYNNLKTSNFAEKIQFTDEHRKNLSKANKGDKNPMFGKHHTKKAKKKIGDAQRGKKGSNLGKFGKDSSNWKDENVGQVALHTRVRNKKPKPENCEICGKPEFYENLGKLELSNIRNHQYTDNPDDYQYVHHSCHKKYDS